jgi:hypothetical protein
MSIIFRAIKVVKMIWLVDVAARGVFSMTYAIGGQS